MRKTLLALAAMMLLPSLAMAEEAKKARRRKKKHAKELQIAESKLEGIMNATNKATL